MLNRTGIESADDFVPAYSEIQNQLMQFIQSLVPNMKDAEEVLQETAITLWNRREDFDSRKGSFFAWACGIARFKAMSYVRKHRPQYILSDTVNERLAEIAVAEALDRDARNREMDALRNCINKLKAADRSVIESHYRQGVSVEEMSKSQGKALSTMYEKMQRIRAQLARCVRRSIELGVVDS